MHTTLCAFIAALVHLRFVFASFLLRTSLPAQPQSPAWAVGRIWFGLMTLTSSRCSQAEIRHPLSHNCLFLTHISERGASLVRAVSYHNRSGCTRRGLDGVQKKPRVNFQRKHSPRARRRMRELDGSDSGNKLTLLNKATLNINIKDGKPEKGNLDRLRDSVQKRSRSFIFETRCSIAWPVHLFGAVYTGFGACRMAAGSCQPPGSSEGNMIL